MTPYEIGILIHYYAFVGDHEDMERQPPIWRQTMNDFIRHGLLEYLPVDRRDAHYPATYLMTARGREYVNSLQRVPLPVQVWVTPKHEQSAAVDGGYYESATSGRTK